MAMPAELVEVAYPARVRYDGPMPTTPDNSDEITYSQALKLMSEAVGMSEWQFVRRLRDGTIPRHYRPFQKRPYYLRSELQELVERERARVGEPKPKAPAQD